MVLYQQLAGIDHALIQCVGIDQALSIVCVCVGINQAKNSELLQNINVQLTVTQCNSYSYIMLWRLFL